jgi:hypothetical protein
VSRRRRLIAASRCAGTPGRVRAQVRGAEEMIRQARHRAEQQRLVLEQHERAAA